MLALMRILVAGATGYVGSRLVPELLRRGHEVVAAASSPPQPDRFSWGHAVDLVRHDARCRNGLVEVRLRQEG